MGRPPATRPLSLPAPIPELVTPAPPAPAPRIPHWATALIGVGVYGYLAVIIAGAVQGSTLASAFFFALVLFVGPTVAFHEYLHARVADREGDPVPALEGRVSLDPRRAFNRIGAVYVPAVSLALTGLFFLVARPVATVPRNYRRGLRSHALVALSAPLANLALGLLTLALLWGCLWLGAALGWPTAVAHGLVIVLGGFGTLNLIMGVMNLLPIPLLDGGFFWGRVFSRRRHVLIQNYLAIGSVAFFGALLAVPVTRRWMLDVAEPAVTFMITLPVLMLATVS